MQRFCFDEQIIGQEELYENSHYLSNEPHSSQVLELFQKGAALKRNKKKEC